MNKKLPLLLLATMTLALSGCGRGPRPTGTSTSDSEDVSGTSYDLEADVKVNYYADFNQKVGKIIYKTETVKNGAKLTQPQTPSAPMPEFPVFKGWSTHEVIDNVNDLWDFSNDVVLSSTGTFELFGIWVAQGE